MQSLEPHDRLHLYYLSMFAWVLVEVVTQLIGDCVQYVVPCQAGLFLFCSSIHLVGPKANNNSHKASHKMLDYFHNSGSLIKTVYTGKRMTDITVFSEFHSLLSVVCCLEPRDVRTSCNIVTRIQLLVLSYCENFTVTRAGTCTATVWALKLHYLQLALLYALFEIDAIPIILFLTFSRFCKFFIAFSPLFTNKWMCSEIWSYQ